MALELWLLYLLAATGLSLTPGPNGLLALTHGALYGSRRALMTVFGGVVGFTLLLGASMAGLGALLAASENAFLALKWAGAAYLVYLGIKTWRAPPVVAPQLRESHVQRPLRELFVQGFVVATSNPKVIVFFAAFLPQFIDPDAPTGQQFVVMAATFAVVEFAVEAVLASLAQRLAPWLAEKGRLFNRISGGTFIGAGTLLAAAQR
jgi:threonine/homoserine/homoserine lactone efflux protein